MPASTSLPSKTHYLFGGPTPWSPNTWTSTDDRVRGGSSTSHLTAYFPASDPNHEHAIFHGHLDTRTLGGAGFASQRTIDLPERVWDLHAYDGLEIEWTEGDGKTYTLVLKDELEEEDRGDGSGRTKSGVVWEAEIKMEREGGRAWVPWGGFRPTYRGRKWEGGGELKVREIKRVGVMMRSFFGEQEGGFRVVLRGVCAVRVGREGGEVVEGVRKGDEDEEEGCLGKGNQEEEGGVDEKSAGGAYGQRGASVTEKGAGWGGWLASMCVVS